MADSRAGQKQPSKEYLMSGAPMAERVRDSNETKTWTLDEIVDIMLLELLSYDGKAGETMAEQVVNSLIQRFKGE